MASCRDSFTLLYFSFHIYSLLLRNIFGELNNKLRVGQYEFDSGLVQKYFSSSRADRHLGSLNLVSSWLWGRHFLRKISNQNMELVFHIFIPVCSILLRINTNIYIYIYIYYDTIYINICKNLTFMNSPDDGPEGRNMLWEGRIKRKV
jgi:hypothetical protein